MGSMRRRIICTSRASTANTTPTSPDHSPYRYRPSSPRENVHPACCSSQRIATGLGACLSFLLSLLPWARADVAPANASAKTPAAHTANLTRPRHVAFQSRHMNRRSVSIHRQGDGCCAGAGVTGRDAILIGASQCKGISIRRSVLPSRIVRRIARTACRHQ